LCLPHIPILCVAKMILAYMDMRSGKMHIEERRFAATLDPNEDHQL
jgi:hypothetical protein